MTQNPSAFSGDFTRNVSRLKLVDSRKLARRVQGQFSLPKGPVLVMPVDGGQSRFARRFAVTAINGCDMLFFDLQTESKYYCNVASAGDTEVVSALLHWDRAGVMPIWLEAREGACGLISLQFQLNDIYLQAFKDANRADYLPDLQNQFNNLLGPGAVEDVVSRRTGQSISTVQLGFLGTRHTQPALDAVQ